MSPNIQCPTYFARQASQLVMLAKTCSHDVAAAPTSHQQLSVATRNIILRVYKKLWKTSLGSLAVQLRMC